MSFSQMDPSITIALIGSATTLIGPIITYLLTKADTLGGLTTLAPDRRRGLTGTWKGKARQEIGPGGVPYEAEVTFTLKAGRKQVTGIGDYAYKLADKPGFARFNCVGGFLHDQFLKLEYKNTNDAALQFGSVVVKMSGDGQRLIGQYVGFGSIAETIVHGTLEVEKQL